MPPWWQASKVNVRDSLATWLSRWTACRIEGGGIHCVRNRDLGIAGSHRSNVIEDVPVGCRHHRRSVGDRRHRDILHRGAFELGTVAGWDRRGRARCFEFVRPSQAVTLRRCGRFNVDLRAQIGGVHVTLADVAVGFAMPLTRNG
jgi:hypothetical protein